MEDWRYSSTHSVRRYWMHVGRASRPGRCIPEVETTGSHERFENKEIQVRPGFRQSWSHFLCSAMLNLR